MRATWRSASANFVARRLPAALRARPARRAWWRPSPRGETGTRTPAVGGIQPLQRRELRRRRRSSPAPACSPIDASPSGRVHPGRDARAAPRAGRRRRRPTAPPSSRDGVRLPIRRAAPSHARAATHGASSTTPPSAATKASWLAAFRSAKGHAALIAPAAAPASARRPGAPPGRRPAPRARSPDQASGRSRRAIRSGFARATARRRQRRAGRRPDVDEVRGLARQKVADLVGEPDRLGASPVTR